MVAGCSPAPVDSALWLEVSDEASRFGGVLNDPRAGVPGPDVLVERLSDAADYWDGTSEPTFIRDDEGSAVFYNVQDREPEEDYIDSVLTFDVFVSSALGDEPAFKIRDWLGGPPRRVYTCYRLEATFIGGWLWTTHRSHDYGEDRLSCPDALVDALGEGAQYREPSTFAG
jgi:hypothetical protein